MKSFFKRLIYFLNNGWVNFLVGDLIIFSSVLIFFRFRSEPDVPSFVLGLSWFIGMDIMGYGFSKIFSSKKIAKSHLSSHSSDSPEDPG